MTNEQRSRVMRAIKSKDTVPELTVRRILHAHGFRYRLHKKDLPGCPDLVFSGRRKAIFVHGCFWHGHSCTRGRRIPKTNREYWVSKIARNVARDADNAIKLAGAGWQLLVVWECEITDPEKLLLKLFSFLGPDAPV